MAESASRAPVRKLVDSRRSAGRQVVLERADVEEHDAEIAATRTRHAARRIGV